MTVQEILGLAKNMLDLMGLSAFITALGVVAIVGAVVARLLDRN